MIQPPDIIDALAFPPLLLAQLSSDWTLFWICVLAGLIVLVIAAASGHDRGRSRAKSRRPARRRGSNARSGSKKLSHDTSDDDHALTALASSLFVSLSDDDYGSDACDSGDD